MSMVVDEILVTVQIHQPSRQCPRRRPTGGRRKAKLTAHLKQPAQTYPRPRHCFSAPRHKELPLLMAMAPQTELAMRA